MREAVAPSISLTAFSCPHCYAHTTQYWRQIKVSFRSNENNTPYRVRDLDFEKHQMLSDMDEGASRDKFEKFLERLYVGAPFIEGQNDRSSEIVHNANISECYNCKKLSFWIGEKLIWPTYNESPIPNIDMPDSIKRDFEEAGAIFTKSPRGAAALLRLCIQKLCIELGQSGKNINDDIAALVKSGLNPRVQRMLDVVRVVGNNAVHPGELDIRDDTEIVNKLFKLVNLIVDTLISQPKAVDELYDGLGQDVHNAIARRDKI